MHYLYTSVCVATKDRNQQVREMARVCLPVSEVPDHKMEWGEWSVWEMDSCDGESQNNM